MFSELGRRLLMLFRRRQFDTDLAEEMRLHRELRQQEEIERGLSPEEAHYAAQRRFGNHLLLREESHDMWGWSWLENALQDLRYGLRLLAKNPGFTFVAVLTLALGIGASTAMFSVIECGILDPFPYAHSHRMAVVVARYRTAGPGYYYGWFPREEFLEFRAHNHVFEQVIGQRRADCIFTSREEALDFNCREATGNFFEFLGVRPWLGRTFNPSDALPGAPPVAVLRYTTWQSKFGGDPRIVGRALTLDNKPVTVIGVMPPRFGWGDSDLWLPHDFAAETVAESGEPVSLVGFLKPGVSFGRAAAEIEVLAKRFAETHPGLAPTGSFYEGESLSVESLLDAVRPDVDKLLYLLFAAVGLVLAIACGNVANLLLARATTRDSEIAIRASLGAGRARLVRQFMVESLLLAGAGGLFGSLFAWPALKALMAAIPEGYIVNEAVLRINQPVLLFAIAVAFGSTFLFGLAPALYAGRKDLQISLSGAGRGAHGGRRQAVLRNMLVIGEFAISMILMTGAGLLMRSFVAVRYAGLGYDPTQVLTASFDLPEWRYKTAEKRNLFNLTFLDRLRTVHGVVSAALDDPPLPYSAEATSIAITGSPSPAKWTAQIHGASDGLFATMHIPLIEGRDISTEDCHAARQVAVVNESFVHRYLAGRSPVGREVTVAQMSQPPLSLKSPALQVIGVVGDIHDNGPSQPAQPSMYVPYTVVSPQFGAFLIRTASAPGLLFNPLRRMLAGMDKQLPLEGEPLQAALDEGWYTEPRFLMTVMSVYALLGLAFVLIGIYSVLSYSVARRTHEVGLRVALGARKSDVLRMVLRQGLKLALIGVGIGLAGALALTRFLSSFLFRVKPTDPLTFAAVALVLTAVALLACYIPARRATKVDPMMALRYE